MAANNLRNLVDKLNPTCRRALEAAAGLCLSRTNYHVEIEHWLVKLLEVDNSDLTRIFHHYDVDLQRVSRELTQSLDAMRTGNGRSPDMSLELLDVIRGAWNLASLDFGATQLRSGYLLTALLTDRALALRMGASAPEIVKISAERLREEVPAVVEGSCEDAEQSPAARAGPGRRRRTGPGSA